MNDHQIIERKIKYDHSIVEYSCVPLKVLNNQEAVLYHKITEPFEMKIGGSILKIPSGSYTVAFYWCDRPYNVYVFRNQQDEVIGLYINIVKDTDINPTFVTFRDLIIDLVIEPNGTYAVLDENELTEPLTKFENGTVSSVLNQLIASVTEMKDAMIKKSAHILKQNKELLN
ncbi:TPA: DUF402 domain-containing protein [Enterococcus faecalis]|uniref:DUF402 domain-containing protein n=1 Tax=Enterococcus TaxID=1350 RepID=UPI00069F240A|nr:MULTISPECIES: DUF402 domain-containing protein [Enterococcus]MBD9867013.1 DUF402 domain-containing protein [Enterococcus faecalis]MDK7765385.1 DUF402 domain-containing protein [Enterococcus faecalis]MDN6561615.1 DUF402 domain-containing protein [Enterococcus sp.]MDN6776503.1 DUF402 domain-containing protein [Enterococcus sp.]MDV2517202.1 DUF402 domain-containing protein [Enterococcus faecalis]